MCGIFGYAGSREAAPLVLQGLRRLEYRGYDSAGMAVLDAGALAVAKVVGGVDNLAGSMARERMAGTTALGHTRWATHGKPSERNAHPHLSCHDDIAVVHNGILTNHGSLRDTLESKGHAFRSETDTEAFAHLVEECYAGDLLQAVQAALPLIEGQYAFAVLHAKHPGQIVAARQGSPLVLGRAAQEGFVASDVPAMLDHSREVVHLADGHIASVGPGRLSIRDAAGRIVEVIPQKIEWSIEDAQRGGFDHFMLKEIHDTPAAIHAALLGRLDTIAHKAPVEGELDPSSLHAIERVRILACGSSYYAALASKRALEELARIPVHVEVASEFRHASTPAMPGTLSLAITQSGETIDTLGALRKARQQGDLTIAVTNVVGSSATREAHATMLLQAGPEISVAATKSFTSQLVAMHLLALHLGSVRRSLGAEPLRTWSHHLRTLPRAVQRVLDRQRPFQQAGQALSASGSVLYIGRQAGHALAMEGALKLKEVSYLHAEGFAAGELKHGPLALVSEGVPVVAVVPPDGSHGAMLSNLSEVGARDGHVLALAQEGDLEVAKVARTTLGIPPVPDLLFPVPASVGLQLMAYHAARALQRPIDRPRNLAKSVTVE